MNDHMKQYPPRPFVTPDVVLAAATELANKWEFDFTPQQIALVYSHRMDGYELAKLLDTELDCEICTNDVDMLDEMQHLVDQHLLKLEKEWFAANNIQPPYPVGTVINYGVIDGIYEHRPATYLVKETHTKRPNSRLLVLWEDALTV